MGCGEQIPAAAAERLCSTMMADRQLRLLGYEVYRFSGYELYTQSAACKTVKEFFARLFERHRIPQFG